MTSRERILAAYRHEQVDRIPCSPRFVFWAMDKVHVIGGQGENRTEGELLNPGVVETIQPLEIDRIDVAFIVSPAKGDTLL